MYAVSSSSRGCFVRRASELYILSTINTEWLLFRTAKKGAGFWRTSFYIKKSSIPKNYNNLDYQSKFLECARTYAQDLSYLRYITLRRASAVAAFDVDDAAARKRQLLFVSIRTLHIMYLSLGDIFVHLVQYITFQQ